MESNFIDEFKKLKEQYQKLERQKIEVEIKKQSVLEKLADIEKQCDEHGLVPADLPKQIDNLQKQLRSTVAELKDKFRQFATQDSQRSSTEEIPF